MAHSHDHHHANAPSPADPVLVEVTRGDMAEFLGLRLETVSRKMTEFQRRGWIAMTSLYHCRLKRRDLLEDLAAGGDAEMGLQAV